MKRNGNGRVEMKRNGRIEMKRNGRIEMKRNGRKEMKRKEKKRKKKKENVAIKSSGLYGVGRTWDERCQVRAPSGLAIHTSSGFSDTVLWMGDGTARLRNRK